MIRDFKKKNRAKARARANLVEVCPENLAEVRRAKVNREKVNPVVKASREKAELAGVNPEKASLASITINTTPIILTKSIRKT